MPECVTYGYEVQMTYKFNNTHIYTQRDIRVYIYIYNIYDVYIYILLIKNTTRIFYFFIDFFNKNILFLMILCVVIINMYDNTTFYLNF